MSKPTLFITDIDGVLCDSRKRMNRINYRAKQDGNIKEYIQSLRKYNKDTEGDKPIHKGIQLYHALMSTLKPDRRIFLTARDEDNFGPAIKWLREHVDKNIEDNDLIMEPIPKEINGEYTRIYKSGSEYKRAMIKKLIKKYDILMIVDDETNNCKVFEEEGLEYLKFKDPDIDIEKYKEKLKNIKRDP